MSVYCVWLKKLEQEGENTQLSVAVAVKVQWALFYHVPHNACYETNLTTFLGNLETVWPSARKYWTTCFVRALLETETTTTTTATVRKWCSRNAKVFDRFTSSAFLSLSAFQTGIFEPQAVLPEKRYTTKCVT